MSFVLLTHWLRLHATRAYPWEECHMSAVGESFRNNSVIVIYFLLSGKYTRCGRRTACDSNAIFSVGKITFLFRDIFLRLVRARPFRFGSRKNNIILSIIIICIAFDFRKMINENRSHYYSHKASYGS